MWRGRRCGLRGRIKRFRMSRGEELRRRTVVLWVGRGIVVSKTRGIT